VTPKIDCGALKTSKSGVLFTPDAPMPDDLLRQTLHIRLAELAAGCGAKR
jgi:hypothetical protein